MKSLFQSFTYGFVDLYYNDVIGLDKVKNGSFTCISFKNEDYRQI